MMFKKKEKKAHPVKLPLSTIVSKSEMGWERDNAYPHEIAPLWEALT